MVDRTEARERGSARKPKHSKRHPFAAIEHRVIDSEAFADLSHSATRLLLLIARQLTADNNGHLQATFKWCRKRGIGSEHTLKTAIADLISHGFLYKARSHGANRAYARYAVTWLPVKEKDGLYLSGFTPYAWRHWEPEKKAASKISRTIPAEPAVSPPNILQQLQEVVLQ